QKSEFFFFEALLRLGAGDALDPMDFQLLTDNLPAAGGFASAVGEGISTPVVIDPVAEDGPVGMVMDVQRGPGCLERLDQHGNANHHADANQPAQQGQRNTPARGDALPALLQIFHEYLHCSPRISSNACPS